MLMEFTDRKNSQVKVRHSKRTSTTSDNSDDAFRIPLTKLEGLHEMYNKIREDRLEMLSNNKAKQVVADVNIPHGKLQVKKSIKSFFTPPPKFQKQFKRGVYFACILIKNEKILMTTEEMLPVIEIDDTIPTTFQTDFHWLVKVSCAWDTVKSLQQDIDRCASCSYLYFRSKILEAVLHMQTVFGMQDLGSLFYRPLKDKLGTIVLCTINFVDDFRTVNVNSTKWIPIERFEKRSGYSEENGAELLTSSITEQIEYMKVSQVVLSPGLYLGYLKMKFLLDSVQVLVPTTLPSVLPFCFVRDDPYVTSDELEWLRQLKDLSACSYNLCTHLKVFGNSIYSNARTLLLGLGVSDTEINNNRFYVDEVIHFNPEVTFILIVPSVENVCSGPNENTDLNIPLNFTFLSIQVYDIIHNMAYHSDFFHKYCKLSLMLETEKLISEHMLREAFSPEEVKASKERLLELQKINSEAEHLWQNNRWMINALTWARDKHSNSGTFLSQLREWHFQNVSELNKVITERNDSKISHLREINDFENCEENTKFADRLQNSKICQTTGTVLEIAFVERPDSVNGKSEEEAAVEKPGIICVYVAYDAGLTNGTSLKLHVSLKTTAREVIDLIIKQLNASAKSKGKDVACGNDCVENFCLVAVLGARERCLRDDFCPLQLQNPWAKGCLYIRRKTELLAAIQQHNCKE